MGRRFSVWPAYADFFAALAVALVGFYALMSKEHRAVQARYNELRQNMTAAQELAAKTLTAISHDIAGAGGITCDKCSDEDICVDVELQFDTSSDRLTPHDVELLHRVATSIRTALERPSYANAREWVQIVVEGHTDCRVPPMLTGRDAFKSNWDLSARRASSVLYQLSNDGLGLAQHYNVISWGLAHSRPKCPSTAACTPDDDACKQANRRTTIRLKFDYLTYQRKGAA